MGKKAVADFIVSANIRLNSANFLIRLRSDNPIPSVYPGQFVNIDIKNTSETFLRRPFSVFEVNYKENTLSVIVKILGKGSKKLTEVKPGEKLSLIYPLGKGFTLPLQGEKILAIGGGSGVAPILFLAKETGLSPKNIDIVLGAGNAEDHILLDEYNQYAHLYRTTDDGSLGVRGFVIHHPVFQENLHLYDRVYACGPNAMMQAVAKEAKAAGVFCEVSLENLMACGFGVCLCCIEPTKHGNKCICTDGPVFNINELKWQI